VDASAETTTNENTTFTSNEWSLVKLWCDYLYLHAFFSFVNLSTSSRFKWAISCTSLQWIATHHRFRFSFLTWRV
jgi:hypothetical protein